MEAVLEWLAFILIFLTRPGELFCVASKHNEADPSNLSVLLKVFFCSSSF